MEKKTVDGNTLKKALISAEKNVELNREVLNNLNVFPVPDGDTGTNMFLTMKAAVNQMNQVNDVTLNNIASAFSTGSLMGARGNSGVILSQLFRGFAMGIKNHKYITPIVIKKAFQQASITAYKAVMKPTEGTILTVAREMAEFASENYEKYPTVREFMIAIIDQGNNTLAKTPEMLPVLKAAGVVDAGGKGLMVILDGAMNYAQISDATLIREVAAKPIQPETGIYAPNAEEIEFGYCTEFMIHSKDGNAELLQKNISNLGDSLMVVQGEGLIKVHIHTNHPGDVLEKALKLGQINDIKIDNMRVQHSHAIMKELNETGSPVQQSQMQSTQKDYGFVVVSYGAGFENIFKDLSVDQIINGGQTMNPSTADMLESIEKINAKHIYIFPNNKNVILAADQAKEMTKKSVTVIPTKSIPEGIASLLSFQEDLSPKDNATKMKEAIQQVCTAQVTYAVRDSETNGKKIHKDDVIGMVKGDILAIGNDREQVTMDLLRQIVNEDNTLISIYYGKDIFEDEAKVLYNTCREEFPQADVELIYGGQPLYYYLLSIE